MEAARSVDSAMIAETGMALKRKWIFKEHI